MASRIKCRISGGGGLPDRLQREVTVGAGVPGSLPTGGGRSGSEQQLGE